MSLEAKASRHRAIGPWCRAARRPCGGARRHFTQSAEPPQQPQPRTHMSLTKRRMLEEVRFEPWLSGLSEMSGAVRRCQVPYQGEKPRQRLKSALSG
eukprot:1860523-Prymnesium_polylepis.1